MTKIGFIGLGNMGAPMAARLVGAGYDVAVWNRTRARTEPLVAAGARLEPTPADLATRSDIVITMLRDAAALRAVVAGRRGVGGGLRRGSVLVDMSTVGVDALEDVARSLPRGVAFVDAPVLGSVEEAHAGTLRIFVGAEDELYRSLERPLKVLGSPLGVGPFGAGAAAKLLANSALIAVLATLGEALALGRLLGLEEEPVYAVLSASPLAAQAKKRRPGVEAGKYAPRFPLALARKDADLIVEAGTRRGVDLRIARASRNWLRDAERAGWGGRDYSAVLGWLLERTARARP